MHPLRSRFFTALAALSALVLADAGGVAARPSASAVAGPGGEAPQERPRLVVFLVVDQLPAYLLERYRDLFEGGFDRLHSQGRVFTAATHDHLLTETSPGHASLSTGTYPARHGVVSNHWWENREGQWEGVENVVDPYTSLTGVPDLAGASPSVLDRPGLADWVLDADSDARIVSLSGKDRGAVLLAGRTRQSEVYWFSPHVGRFVTSEWYRRSDADWVTRFNEDELAGLADSIWVSTVPADAADRSRPDTAVYEGDGVHTAFPHAFADAREANPQLTNFWLWWSGTPGPDRAALALAREAVRAEDLGDDDVTDLLALSLSQTDYVGHDYGPLSREQLDNLLRLDRELGAFFSWLDEEVGEGAWTVVLTSDHGAQEAPEATAARGEPGVRLVDDSLATLQAALNGAVRESAQKGPDAFARDLAGRAEAISWIGRAWAQVDLPDAEPSDTFAVLARRSFRQDRRTGILGRFGVEMLYAPGALPFGYARGSTHLSGYMHDRHVPLVFMGAGVEPGRVDDPASTVDVAPTLAGIMGIRPPGDLDGRPLPLR